MNRFFSTEPAMIVGLVNAAITLAVTFGLDLSNEQIGAILAFVNILLAVITRQTVVPVTTHVEQVQDALYAPKPNVPNLIPQEAVSPPAPKTE